MSKQKEIVKIRYIYVGIPCRMLNRVFNEGKLKKTDPRRIRAFAKEAAAAIDKLRHAQSIADVLILRHDIRTY